MIQGSCCSELDLVVVGWVELKSFLVLGLCCGFFFELLIFRSSLGIDESNLSLVISRKYKVLLALIFLFSKLELKILLKKNKC